MHEQPCPIVLFHPIERKFFYFEKTRIFNAFCFCSLLNHFPTRNVSSLQQISFSFVNKIIFCPKMENSTKTTRTTYQLFQFSFNFVHVVIYLLSFLGNLLTVTAVIKFDHLHKKPTNILIVSMAIADGLLGKIYHPVENSKVDIPIFPKLHKSDISCIFFTKLTSQAFKISKNKICLHW